MRFSLSVCDLRAGGEKFDKIIFKKVPFTSVKTQEKRKTTGVIKCSLLNSPENVCFFLFLY